MNKHKKNLLALSIAGMGALTALYSVSAASINSNIAPSNSSTTRSFRDRKINDGDHLAIKNAITSGDYQAFLLATKNKPADMPTITQEQFNVIVAAEKLRVAGDTVGAKKLLTDAGIQGRGMMMGKGHKKGGEEMKAFIDSLTDTQKEILKQAHDLKKAGKKDEADKLLKNSGIVFPSKKNN